MQRPSSRMDLVTTRFAWTPWACVALHVLGVVAIVLVLRHGTVAQPDSLRRATYIRDHLTAWRVGWLVWMLSAVSLVAFYIWWHGKVSAGVVGMLAIFVATVGMACDISGELIYTTVLTRLVPSGVTASGGNVLSPTWNPVDFLNAQATSRLLTAGIANGLYTVGGVLLTLKTKDIPRWVRVALWGTWAAGILITLSALASLPTPAAPAGVIPSGAIASGALLGMMISTAVLFPLLCGWISWMGWQWR